MVPGEATRTACRYSISDLSTFNIIVMGIKLISLARELADETVDHMNNGKIRLRLVVLDVINDRKLSVLSTQKCRNTTR